MDESEAVMRSLLAAYPDRLAKRRSPNKPKALMVGGKGVQLASSSGVTEAELFLCIDVDAGGVDATVRQASLVQQEWLDESLLTSRVEMFYHPTQKQVVARKRRYWDDLLLEETPTAIEDDEMAARALATAAKQVWHEVFPADDSPVASLLERIRFLSHHLPDLQLPEIDQGALDEILVQLCRGRRSIAQLQSAPWLDWIRGMLTGEQLRVLDREAPEKIQVPSGSLIRLQYDGIKPPILAVRIQEVFSWRTTPRLAAGRVPVLMHLLAPNMRPQQITDDLESFWNRTYAVVRAELKRRYPKHAWPEDPWKADPERKGGRKS
jgi:ATP-dependent helicase HrpB